MNANNWGPDQMMVIAAFRYCLGRMTYIVEDCAKWIVANWDQFSDNTKFVIQRDLEEEFRRDDEARASLSTYKPLGQDCDRKQWERVRELYER